MAMQIPELRKELTKAQAKVERLSERVTMLTLQNQQLERDADQMRLSRDINGRVFLGFMMGASTLNELRKWFADFVEEMDNAVNSGEVTNENATAILERHGVSIRIPEVGEIRSGIWRN